jgi:hypothetical protein
MRHRTSSGTMAGGRGDEETATATTISTTMMRNRETMLSSAREGSRRSRHPRKRKLVTTTNLLPSAAHRGLLLGAGCVVCVAVAMHAASIRSGFDLLLSGIDRWSRAIMWTAALVGSTRESVKVQRRQASDVTSEWPRYAHHPGARGRAFLCLAAQVLPCASRREFPAPLTRSVVETC